jgi:RNA polymerase sigma-70 factor, ECF subfamily
MDRPESYRGERERCSDPQDDPVCIGRALQRGDPAATRIVRRRVQRIVSFRGYRFSREDRRDIEQEVMTQIWQAAQSRGGDFGGGLWGFVEVVAARRCIDWLRTRRLHSQLQPDQPSRANPLEDLLTGERRQLLESAVSQLDAPCRELISLRVGQGRSYREIAGLMGVSEGSLRIRLHRCVKKATEIIQRQQGGDSARGQGA